MRFAKCVPTEFLNCVHCCVRYLKSMHACVISYRTCACSYTPEACVLHYFKRVKAEIFVKYSCCTALNVCMMHHFKYACCASSNEGMVQDFKCVYAAPRKCVHHAFLQMCEYSPLQRCAWCAPSNVCMLTLQMCMLRFFK